MECVCFYGTGILVHSQVGLLGRYGDSGMLVCLGFVSGIEKVVSGARAPDELATLLLPEPEGVQIRILYDEAQPCWLAGKVVQRLQEPDWIIRR